MAQNRKKPTEMSAGLSLLRNIQPKSYNFERLSEVTRRQLSAEDYVEQTWYGHKPQVREYRLGMARRQWHSDNYFREFSVTLDVAGQFQHRTIFIGTKESLEEEVLTDPDTDTRRQRYAFETEVYSRIRDMVMVNPGIQGKLHINQRINFTLSASLGIGLPVRSGYQVSSYSGMTYRTVRDGEIIEESRKGSGLVEFEWEKEDFHVALSPRVSSRVELKAFEMKPFLAFAGTTVGRQLHVISGSDFNYIGMELGLISMF